MKLLFDHNLPPRLVTALKNLYPNSQHVRQIGMITADDAAIWSYAQEHKMIMVSKDSDFYHLSMLLGPPPKVIWIRLGNCTTVQIQNLLQARHADILAFSQDLDVAFLALF
jgi:predicted nuclease of predicted toxin-antitoxin system